MKPETKRVFRPYFVWQDEDHERWLEQMAREGWRLTKVGILKEFERCAPAEVRYRLDYRPRLPGGRDEYLAIFRDAGWEPVGSFGGWYTFRATSPNAPEVFTDASSKVGKYRQLLAFVAVVLMLNLFFWSRGWQPVRTGWAFEALRAFQLAVVVLLSYAVIRIMLRIRRLRSSST